MCAQILGFSRVRVSIRVSLVYLVCATTLGNNVAPSVGTDGKKRHSTLDDQALN